MMEFVSWDDDIPKIWKVIKIMFQTTNQFVVPTNGTFGGLIVSTLLD